MRIKNTGPIGQAFKTAEGLISVKPGGKAEIKGLKLDKDQIRHYEERGIVFDSTPKGKAAKSPAAQKSIAAEQERIAQEERKAEQDEKDKVASDTIDALATAEKELETAKTDDEKKVAQAKIDSLTKTLEELTGPTG